MNRIENTSQPEQNTTIETLTRVASKCETNAALTLRREMTEEKYKVVAKDTWPFNWFHFNK